MKEGITVNTTHHYSMLNKFKKQGNFSKQNEKNSKMNFKKLSLIKSREENEENDHNDSEGSETTKPDDITLIDLLISCISENRRKIPQGRRFKNLENYFALLSFMGPHYYEILHTTLLFPSYRTAQLYRKNIIDSIDISNNMFNGDSENISVILEKCLPMDFSSRSILAVDSAHVTPYVSIHCNGTVRGLIEKKSICEKLAQKLVNDDREFSKFVCSNQKNIIGAEFVLMLIPIDASHRAIPICSFQSNHGTATESIIGKIFEILSLLQTKKIQVIGIATDGDHQYSKMSTTFMTKIIDNIEKISELTVSKIIENHDEICHFSDPFHLVKRDRYRKVSKDYFIIDPWNESAQYSLRDLKELGIPDYVLSPEKARKMEDLLPFKFFSKEVLAKTIERNDHGLFFAMLPSTLLLESIHSETLSRKERIDYLMIGSSFLILYEFYKKIIKIPTEEFLDVELNPIQTNIIVSPQSGLVNIYH